MIPVIVIFGVLDIFSIFVIGKEVVNLRDFIYTFKCQNCGEHFDIIQHGEKCKKCHRNIGNITKQWDHYLTFRVNIINTREVNSKFEYSKCIIPFKLELAVDIFCFIILSVMLIGMIMGVL